MGAGRERRWSAAQLKLENHLKIKEKKLTIYDWIWFSLLIVSPAEKKTENSWSSNEESKIRKVDAQIAMPNTFLLSDKNNNYN